MTIGFEQIELDGTCGVGLIYNFTTRSGRVPEVYEGGTGLFCAGYINNTTCKEVYEEMRNKYKIILRTKPRLNENSGNMFCFVVYDRDKDSEKDFDPAVNEKKVWPFEEET